MRRALRILAIVACVLLVLGLAARWYLSSSAVTHKVEAQLAQLYGGPVAVEASSVGLNNTTVQGIRLFEDGKASGQPWFTAQSLTADVSLWQLVSGGAMPKRVRVAGGDITLRFDKNGSLLTQFPGRPPASPGEGALPEGPPPAIDVENSRLTLRKEGVGDVVLTAVTLQAKPDGNALALSGSAENAEWGKLNLSGTLDAKAGSGALTLTSAGTVTVTRAMLNGLPFVPASVWEAVQAEGQTPVTVTIGYGPSAKEVHYRVELEPKGTKVTVPAADLSATDAQGKLIIEDGVVKLRGVKGKAHGGTLAVTGDLDFRGEASHLDFASVEAAGLDVRRLPASWGLPKQIDGQLYASGSLRLTVAGGKINTTGDLKAEIRNARLAGQPTDGPVQIELAPEGPPLQVGGETGEGGGAVVQAQPPAADRRPARVTIKLKLKDADVAQMLDQLDVKLPLAVAGRLSFQGQAALPVDSVKDARTYAFNGKATLTDLTVGAVKLQRVEAEARYEDGVLKVEPLTGVAVGDAPAGGDPPRGTLKGKLTAQVAPPGDVTAALALDGIPLGPLAREAGLKGQEGGELTGSLTARVSLKRLEEKAEAEGNGTLVVKRARALGWTLEDGSADVVLKGDALRLTNVRARLEGTPVTGSAEVRLKAPYPYHAKLELKDADLAAVQRLAPDVRPPVKVEGRLTATAEARGTLDPFRLDSTATVSAKGLKVEDVVLEDVRFNVEVGTDRVNIKDLTARLYGGMVSGGGTVPLDPKAAGTVAVTLEGIDVGALLKGADFPLPIEGKASGTVKGTIPPALAGQERKVSVALGLKAPKLRVQGIDAEALHGTVRYDGGEVTYQFEARSLGGTVEVEGKVPAKAPAPGEEAGGGKVRLHGLRLDRLGRQLSGPRHRIPLSGVVNAEVAFRHFGPGYAPVGEGRVVVTDLRWDGSAWIPRLQADVDVTPERVLVRDLTGSLGQGIVRARLALALRPPARSWFTVSLEGAEAAQLLAPWPDLKDAIQGPVQARLRGTIGREWTARGTVALARGKVAGMEVSDWRVPVGVVFTPKYGRGRLEVRATSAHLAQGRVTGDATYSWGTERRLDGKLQFTNLELRGLVRSLSESAYVGAGKITGRVEFSGPGPSLDELTAGIDATLAQAQALEFPGLKQLGPFLAVPTSSSFKSGQLRARLARGVVRVERLSLQGGPADIFATGTVTTQGRLGLDVHANTRRVGLNANALRLAGIRIPTTGAVPVAVLLKLNDYVSNRTVHARVTGTFRSPTVQLLPRAMLQDEVIRFFLREAGIPQF